MTPEIWERLKPLFNEAVEKPPQERDVFIASVCNQYPELQPHLIALLGAHEQKTGSDDPPFDVKSLLVNALTAFGPGKVVLGRFKIVRCVGSGGMGDVYEATDLELGLTVALKTIHTDIAGDTGILQRFKKEVQLARRIGGPNVCRIHELFVVPGNSTTPDLAFLTMEFLAGISLSDKISQGGPIPWRQAQTIALDICAGLTAIHQAGIVHRDLKSRNIMLVLRDGRESAVLMDFGLARELSPAAAADQTGLTRPGAILGTPEYMAPEQFEGGQVTAATDVYALGVVLYEVVTGKHPFASSTPVGAAVRRGKRPEPASSIQRHLPRRWDQVISKCLEFEAARRYQSAIEVINELQQSHLRVPGFHRKWSRALVAGVTPSLLLPCLMFIPVMRERLQGALFSSHEKHIAVLPFDVGTGNPETQALGDGLMDSLSGRLANLDNGEQSLWVVPASEVRINKVSDASKAWTQFGATIAVKGRLERHERTIHCTFAVINAKEMRQIGSVDLEDTAGDFARLEDEAVQRISRLINIRPTSKTAADPNPPRNHAAYEDYLVALGYMQRYDKPGNLDLAIAALKQAVESDKSFSLGYTQMGEAYRLKYQLDQNPAWIEEAEKFSREAARLDTEIPSTYITLARIHGATGKYDLAIQEFRQALKLDPRDADAIGGLAHAYEHLRRIPEAEAAYKDVIALRPDYWDGYDELARFYDRQGKHAEAIAEYKHAIQLTPDNAQVYANLGAAYVDAGDANNLALAEQTLRKSIELAPSYAAYANLGTLYGSQNRYADAAAMTEKALQLNGHDYVVWENLAIAYEWLKDREKATAARKEMLPRIQDHLETNTEDPAAHSVLAMIYAHDGEKQKAIESIHASIALAPDDPSVLSNIADAYELLGDRSRAIESVNKALKKGFLQSDLQADPYLQGLLQDPRLHLSPN